MPSVVLSAVEYSHALAVLSCLSLPSHFSHSMLGVGLGFEIGTENSVIFTLFSSVCVKITLTFSRITIELVDYSPSIATFFGACQLATC